MTRFEQIAAVFPLHAQRIAECKYEQHGSVGLDWFLIRTLDEEHDARTLLQGAFIWNGTVEGHEYWSALARVRDTWPQIQSQSKQGAMLLKGYKMDLCPKCSESLRAWVNPPRMSPGLASR